MAVRHPIRRGRKSARLLAAALAAAIGAGAGVMPARAAGPINWTEARKHWSFRPPVAHPAPKVRQKAWPRQPLDYFILARLEKEGLHPSPEADPRTLIRRVTYDLTGLPPTPDEVEAFVRECAAEKSGRVGEWESGGKATPTPPLPHSPTPDARGTTPLAYERLVERLLASPRFGERMASMWLPLARFAEDQAHQVGNDTKFFYPNAHLYRDWVIGAFNRDVPYDQFVRLQLAADLVAKDAGRQAQPAPASGVKPVALVAEQPASPTPPPATAAPQATAPNELAALGFLGLGPKYYNRERLDVQADEWEDRVDTVTRTFQGLTVACARCHDHKYDPVTTHDYYALAGIFASTKMVNQATDGTEDTAGEAAKMRKDTMHVVREGKAQDLNVFIRGNVENKGPVVPRRFLEVLSKGEPVAFKEGSGRKELAEAIATPTNPLTARVYVNRLWAQMFGMGLVSTPSNFGAIGDTPSHPELFDDFAVRFMKNGWSTKQAIREMVFSSTYRQTSDSALYKPTVPPTPSAVKPARGARLASRIDPPKPPKPNNPKLTDPANRLLWRMSRRRLSIEQWRDGVLAVSGQLDSSSGPSMELTDPANHRRTVYARVSRLKLNDLLMQFDYPDANVHAEKRSITNTPMQKLFLLNSPFMQSEAKEMAAKLTADPNESDAARIRRAYQVLYGREPSAQELTLGQAYLQQPEANGMPRWDRYAQVLLVANEMLYID